MNDLVYMYRRHSGPNWGLRYSLRSAEQNLKFRDLWIVGDLPPFIKRHTVRHIRGATGNGKYRNVFNQILAAALNPEVSDSFLLMNDDFYILYPADPFPYYHRGTLGEWRDTCSHDRRHQYYGKLLKTIELIGENAKSYEVHCPFLFEKQKLLDLVEKYQLPQGTMLRSLYAHAYGIEGIRTRDCKIIHPRDITLEAPFLSSSDAVERTFTFRDAMYRRFPLPSRFETGNIPSRPLA